MSSPLTSVLSTDESPLHWRVSSPQTSVFSTDECSLQLTKIDAWSSDCTRLGINLGGIVVGFHEFRVEPVWCKRTTGLSHVWALFASVSHGIFVLVMCFVSGLQRKKVERWESSGLQELCARHVAFFRGHASRLRISPWPVMRQFFEVWTVYEVHPDFVYWNRARCTFRSVGLKAFHRYYLFGSTGEGAKKGWRNAKVSQMRDTAAVEQRVI